MVHGKKVAPAPVEAPVQPPSQPVAPKLSLPPSFSKSDEVAQDPLKHVIIFLEKRLLNLEKRKERLDGYQKQINEGIQLRSNKEMAVAKRKEVAGSINFAQELLGVLNLLTTEVEKIQQASKREEELNQITLESNRSQFVAKSLAIFKLFSSNSQIQQDFIEGKDNAVELDQSEVDLLLSFSENCLFFTHDTGDDVIKRSEDCGQHLNQLFDKSTTAVCNSTYASIAAVASKVFDCGYFQSLPDLSEKVEVKDESKEENAIELHSDEEGEEEVASDVVKTGIEFSSNVANRISPTTVAITQQDIDSSNQPLPESSHVDAGAPNKEVAPPSAPKSAYDQLKNIIGNAADPQLQQVSFMSFQVEEEQQKQEPEQPEVAKRPPRTVEEVLADVQGQYNFLQDSMLDFDNTGSNVSAYPGVGMQSPAPNPGATEHQEPDLVAASGFNSNSHASSISKNTFLQNGPSMATNEIGTRHNQNSLYASHPIYQGKADVYAPEAKLMSNQEGQVQSPGDNLGMGQTTFGSSEPTYSVDLPVRTQYNESLHSVDAYQNKQSDMVMIKSLPDSSYSTSFNSLHGTSQSPFEGALAGNKIPDPIPMPSSASIDPSQVHIPFPNDKMSGYRSYSANSPTIDSPSVAGNVDNENDRFPLDEKQHQPSLLSAGDAVHIPSPGLKLDSNPIDSVSNEVKPEEKNEIASSSQMNPDKTAAHQINRNNRNPTAYPTSSSNYNRGNNAARQQGQPVGGGFYQNRSTNYRPPPNRNFGSFDSMGHPKHFGNTGGGYQHPQNSGVHPFSNHYNRQDNSMYGGMQRRGAGGSGRGNRGFPSRGNMRGPNNNNYNRSRTFRPHNSEPVA